MPSTKHCRSAGDPSIYATDEARWQALVDRDRAADGEFFYSVRTTGIYCRPSCASRLANRKNVQFHDTCRSAEAAGFRACKRCRPQDRSLTERHVAAIVRACRFIEQAEELPQLDELASSVDMSVSHFHRMFKAQTGITPKAYATAQRTRRLREGLTNSNSVIDAIYDAGFNSSSRFYESSTQILGMTAKSFRTGGSGTTIRFAIGECWLGAFLVAATDKGLCAISLGDDPAGLVHDLEDRFPKAELIGGDAEFEQLVAQVVGWLENPAHGLGLPLDIRGTVFQQRVWAALQAIPFGSTMTYTEIAKRIGEPKSVRAVAQACGANPLAVAIPCHRVVRRDGSLAGYRWGIERKQQLLNLEKNMAPHRSH